MQFSIITVCRNDLEGLKLTRDSIYNQSFDDFEWIVVDGNSTDGTVDWLKRLSDDNLSWTSEPDNGIFDAMNKGMLRATGNYLLFMNSFDELADDKVLYRINEVITGSGGRTVFIYGDSLDITPSGDALYRKSKSHNTLWRGMFTQHQSMFFINNRDILFNTEYKITADYAYIGHHLKKADNSDIHYVNTPVCKFKLGGTNESYRFRALKEDFMIRRKVFGLSIFTCIVLYKLHLLHTLQKRIFPGTAKLLRYEKNENSRKESQQNDS